MGGTEGRAALALPAVLLDSPSNRVLPATHASAGANLHSYLGPALLKTTDTTGFTLLELWNLRRRRIHFGTLFLKAIHGTYAEGVSILVRFF